MKKKLKPTLGLVALLFYGVGDVLGAGIYALVGKVAAEASVYSWAAFVAAFSVAFLTGMSYAELTARYPNSAGSSYFLSRAFSGRGKLSQAMPLLSGWFVTWASVVSLAAAGRAFSGYFQEFALVPEPLVIVAFVSLLTFINFRGIGHSSIANIFCTIVETGGLLLIIGAGLALFTDAPPAAVNHAVAPSGVGIFVGASLAFYAFMGFEDLANVAEEAKNPRRDIPIAMMASLVVAGVVYVLTAWLATRFVSVEELAASQAPLVLLAERVQVPLSGAAFAVLSLFAVSNTALLNAVTGSRLLFGLSEQGLLPEFLGRAHPKTRTPHLAIGVVWILAIVLSIAGSVEVLAGATSLLLLLTFCLVHVALLRLRSDRPKKGFRVPTFVPVLGIACTLGLVALLPVTQQLVGGAVVAVGILAIGLYLWRK